MVGFTPVRGDAPSTTMGENMAEEKKRFKGAAVTEINGKQKLPFQYGKMISS